MTVEFLAEQMEPLLKQFAQSDAAVLHVRSGDFELYLSKDPASGGVSASAQRAEPSLRQERFAEPASRAESSRPAAADKAATTPPSASELPPGATIVRAPNLGTFYRSPKPGAAPYVEIGSSVAVGDEVCLIEVMKLFTAVRSEHAGRVAAILAEDGAMVEEGQPLLALVAR